MNQVIEEFRKRLVDLQWAAIADQQHARAFDDDQAVRTNQTRVETIDHVLALLDRAVRHTQQGTRDHRRLAVESLTQLLAEARFTEPGPPDHRLLAAAGLTQMLAEARFGPEATGPPMLSGKIRPIGTIIDEACATRPSPAYEVFPGPEIVRFPGGDSKLRKPRATGFWEAPGGCRPTVREIVDNPACGYPRTKGEEEGPGE